MLRTNLVCFLCVREGKKELNNKNLSEIEVASLFLLLLIKIVEFMLIKRGELVFPSAIT